LAPTLTGFGTSDLPGPESLEIQRQMYHQQLDENLANAKKILRDKNAAQKASLKQQSEYLTNAYVSMIDHEVKVEEVNLDRQAYHEQLQLKHVSAHYKAMLEQQASAAIYEYERTKGEEGLRKKQEEACSSSTSEQWATLTLVQPSLPTVPLLSAYKEIVLLPQDWVPAMVPPTVPCIPIAADGGGTSGVMACTPTTLSGSPQMSAASSFVPWPQGLPSPTTTAGDAMTATDPAMHLTPPQLPDASVPVAIPKTNQPTGTPKILPWQNGSVQGSEVASPLQARLLVSGTVVPLEKQESWSPQIVEVARLLRS